MCLFVTDLYLVLNAFRLQLVSATHIYSFAALRLVEPSCLTDRGRIRPVRCAGTWLGSGLFLTNEESGLLTCGHSEQIEIAATTFDQLFIPLRGISILSIPNL